MEREEKKDELESKRLKADENRAIITS